MVQKIKEALKQGHKNLGLSDEVFERVASSVETFITDEAQIEGFVTSESTKALLKSYQSVADKARAEAKAKYDKKTDGSEKDDSPKPETKPEEKPTENPVNIAEIVAQAVSAAITPLQDKLTAFEAENAAKSALTNGESAFKANEYVKKYTTEADMAWKYALKINSKSGNKMTAEELQSEAMDFFNDAVKSKGVDTSKPFDSDGSAESADADFSKMKELLKSEGIDLGVAEQKAEQ